MNFPIHIDTISMGLHIVYIKGSLVEFINYDVTSLPELNKWYRVVTAGFIRVREMSGKF